MKERTRSFFLVLAFFALVWPAFLSFKEALVSAGHFHLTGDEAYHTELIENLAQTGKYRLWNSAPFALHLTTGPAIIVPAAALNRILPISSVRAGRAIVIFYQMLFALTIGCLALRLLPAPTRNTPVSQWIWSGIAVGLFYEGFRGLQETNYFMYGVLGDGVGSAFLLFCVWALYEKRIFWAGVFASLAVFCKPYYLLLPLTLAFWSVAQEIFLQKPFFKKLHPLLPVMAGLLLPLFLFFLWVIATLGWSDGSGLLASYPEIMRATNGAGLPTTGREGSDVLSRVTQHYVGLGHLLKPRSAIMLLLGFSIALYRGVIKKTMPPAFLFLLSFAALHFCWWLLVTPTPEARYFLPVATALFLFACAALAGWVYFIFNKFLGVTERPGKETRVFLSLAVCYLFLHFGSQVAKEWIKITGNPEDCGVCRQILLQNYWKKLDPRPTDVWSTSTGYAPEVDSLLSAPYQVHVFDPDQALPDFSKETWVVVGEYSKEGTLPWLTKHGCNLEFGISQGQFGFWRCAGPSKSRLPI